MKTLGILFSTVLLLLVCSTALAIKPVPYGPNVNSQHIDPWFDCSVFDGMDHTLGLEYVVSDYGLMHFDVDGNLVKLHGFTDTLSALTWNSDNDKTLGSDDVIGGGEHTHYTVLFDEYGKDVLYRETGVILKIVLPDYGPIGINAGMATWVWDYDLETWLPEKITSNYFSSEDEMYALCLYHLE